MNLQNLNVLITGGEGMLATSLKDKIKAKTVYCLSRKELDITSHDSIKKVISEINPDIIIHTAAFTNVEVCEVEKEKSFDVNCLASQNLASELIKKNPNAKFVYISSTGIYGTAKNEAYTESDTPIPTTVHHETKFRGEGLVAKEIENHLIIRTGWLFGGSVKHEKNFVYKRYLDASKNDTIYGDPSQKGNPTYVNDLTDQIVCLIEKECRGVYNCVGEGFVTRMDYVSNIIKSFNLSCRVEVAPDGMFKRIAPVSKNETALNKRLQDEGINLMRPWIESLNEYVNILKGQINEK